MIIFKKRYWEYIIYIINSKIEMMNSNFEIKIYLLSYH